MNIQDLLPQSVSGKNVLVTGGTTGIGRAIVLLLASQGANVVFFGHEEQHLKDALADILPIAKGKLFGFVADCGTEDGIADVFKQVDEKLEHLDILVNNAAIGFGNATDVSYNDLQHVLNINLLSYLACCGGAITRMEKNGSGHIVNIGSLSAQVREATGSVYVATKAAIRAYSEALRKEVNKHGIKVSLIEPGAVDTDMQQKPTEEKLKKVENEEMLQATDIAAAVLYCLSQPKRCDVIELKIRPHLQLI
ncbi:SDR family oxidoreductase [Flavobacterium psychrotrophum]|uniref:SDR family oxidoreductase n=1 Tax=Flavobacterium psychrotrophum TaxID=2294119 RepID=UPI000E315BB0|nr:SDR family oxidoreductase [Flavobacterium psychrotrophum]